MGVKGVGVVLMESTGLMGWVFWKFIRRVLKDFSRLTRFEVSDGSKISFWNDFFF